MKYSLRPIYRDPAFDFIDAHHRHYPRPTGWLFGTSAIDGSGDVAGVITVGRVIARGHHDVASAEVTRCCVRAGLASIICRRGKNHADSICSLLYAAAVRACRALGYRRVITYLLGNESAVTMKALKDMGWKFVRIVKGRSWDCPSRRRMDRHPTVDKQLWEVLIGGVA